MEEEVEMEVLLRSWGIGEVYINRLIDQEINSVHLLELMEEEMIKTVFNKMGAHLLFKKKFEEYKASKKKTDNQSAGKADYATNDISLNGDEVTEETATVLVDAPSGPVIVDAPPLPIVVDILTATPQPRKRSLDPTDVIGDLHDLLESHSGLDGRLILSEFSEEGKLSEDSRETLAAIIVNQYMKDDYKRKFPHEAETKITAKIMELFPTESKDYWVSPNTSSRQSCIGRGKLLIAYYTKRRKLNKHARLSHPAPNADQPIEDDEDNEDILWLRNNKQPWADLVEHWKASSNIRLRKLRGGNQSVAEYMMMYPALKEPSGFLLFEMDFNSMFNIPNNSLHLFTEWPKLAAFIQSKVPKDVLKGIQTSKTNEGKKVRTLLALPYLFKVTTVAKKRNKQFRPSRAEVADALLFQVGVQGDIEQKLEQRSRSKYEPFGLHLSPQAIVVGANVDEVKDSYVRVEGSLYHVENPLKAVDIAFKAMHALDSKYHAEANREWLFLERAVYKINLNQEKQVPHLRSVIDDYNNFVVAPTS